MVSVQEAAGNLVKLYLGDTELKGHLSALASHVIVLKVLYIQLFVQEKKEHVIAFVLPTIVLLVYLTVPA